MKYWSVDMQSESDESNTWRTYLTRRRSLGRCGSFNILPIYPHAGRHRASAAVLLAKMYRRIKERAYRASILHF